MKRMGIEGEVMIECIVDATGYVRRAQILSSAHRDFNDPVLRAVRQWRFEPGKKNNKPVNTRVRIPFMMHLRQ